MSRINSGICIVVGFVVGHYDLHILPAIGVGAIGGALVALVEHIARARGK